MAKTDPKSAAAALPADWRDDLELLELVGEMDAGDPSAVPPVLAKLAGDREADVRESLRNGRGVIPISACRRWILDVITAANAKNS